MFDELWVLSGDCEMLVSLVSHDAIIVEQHTEDTWTVKLYSGVPNSEDKWLLQHGTQPEVESYFTDVVAGLIARGGLLNANTSRGLLSSDASGQVSGDARMACRRDVGMGERPCLSSLWEGV